MQCSTINYSNLENTFRIDAEYYQPLYLQVEAVLQAKKCVPLSTYAHISDGNHLSIAEDFSTNSGVRYLRGQDVTTSMFIEDSNPVFIPESIYSKLARSHIFRNDVLLTIVGANTGCVGYVFNPPEKLTANCKLGIIRSNADSAAYLYGFLISKYGQSQIQRCIRGGGQTGIVLPDIRTLQVPCLDTDFQHFIERLINLIHSQREQTFAIYQQAENILLKELELENWKPKHQLSYIKNFSETQSAERIDAEYSQPMYEDIIAAVKRYKGGYNNVASLVNLTERNFNPEPEKEYRYIELSNISSNGEITGYTEAKGNELPTRARRKVKQGDLIISSIEGSLDSIALVTDPFNNMLCSTGFFAVSHKATNAETLLLLFKSKIGQLQLKKGCSGTILTAISNDEFNEIVFPIIPDSIQSKLKDNVAEMYASKAQSKALLEIAKRAVEMAIEQNEKIAEKWINNEVARLGIELAL